MGGLTEKKENLKRKKTMFGLKFEEKTDGWIGYRAILSGGYVDTLPDRGSYEGEEDAIMRIRDWANDGAIGSITVKGAPCRGLGSLFKLSPWKAMLKWAESVSGSSGEILEIKSPEGYSVLRATPRASYGYFYIGIGELEEGEVE